MPEYNALQRQGGHVMNRKKRNRKRKIEEWLKHEAKKEVAEKMRLDGWGGQSILKYTGVDTYYSHSFRQIKNNSFYE